jgi:hypothetical protein
MIVALSLANLVIRRLVGNADRREVGGRRLTSAAADQGLIRVGVAFESLPAAARLRDYTEPRGPDPQPERAARRSRTQIGAFGLDRLANAAAVDGRIAQIAVAHRRPCEGIISGPFAAASPFQIPHRSANGSPCSRSRSARQDVERRNDGPRTETLPGVPGLDSHLPDFTDSSDGDGSMICIEMKQLNGWLRTQVAARKDTGP